MDVIEYTKLVHEVTQPPKEENKIWSEVSDLCMVYIEFRNMDIIRDNLNNICNVYGGSDTALTIIHSGDNKDIILDTTKDWKNVTYMQLYDHNIDINEYNRLFTSYNFWDKFSKFTHVLINQWDSYLFKRIPEKFFNYDIVGGPCGHFYVRDGSGIINICSQTCKCPRCIDTGGNHHFKDNNFADHPYKYFILNGGFCLRKVESIKELCRVKPWSGEPEDVYFAISNLTRSSRSEACEFGIQDFKYDGIPVGCHQIWIKHEKSYIMELFKNKKTDILKT